MRYGIFSDIHANLEALETVLEAMGGVDRYLCVGDLVGYGANPNECCERVRELDALTVLGNHDAAAIGRHDITWFNDWAKAAILWTRRQLTDENHAWLESLPDVPQVVDDCFTIVHGSLREPVDEYITDPYTAYETMKLMQNSLCFIGHTHIAEVYELIGERKMKHSPLTEGGKVQLQPDRKYVINCGGVGQPRDRNPKASFGIYDTDKQEVTVFRVDYDINTAARKILAAGLPPVLAKRLYVGR